MATVETRALDAARAASTRLGVDVGRQRARAERWRQRAILAERELRAALLEHERVLRRADARVRILEARLDRLRRPW